MGLQSAAETIAADDHGISLDCTPVSVRKVMQVHLSIVGARHIPSHNRPKGTLRVHLWLKSNCDSFKLNTAWVPCPSSLPSQPVWWNQSWSFQAETSTHGFSLELLFRPSSLFQRIAANAREITLGRLQFPWKRVLESPSLSCDGWFRLAPWLPGIQQKSAHYVFVSVSVTPPIVVPQLFRSINSIPTDDTACSMNLAANSFIATTDGCWMSRTVIDSYNRDVFIVRVSFLGEKRILIHRGAWEYAGYSRFDDRRRFNAARNIVASAEEIVTEIENSATATERRWGFLASTSQLIVRRPTTESNTISALLFELRGSLQNKLSLVSGRKLKYEVTKASVEDEAGFVTVVRHHPSPGGRARASALFNWKSGIMEA